MIACIFCGSGHSSESSLAPPIGPCYANAVWHTHNWKEIPETEQERRSEMASVLFENDFFKKAPACLSLKTIQQPTAELLRSCILEMLRHVLPSIQPDASRANEEDVTPSTPPFSSALESAAKSDQALSYIPSIFADLDSDCRDMLVKVLQAMRDGGYEDGFRDAQQQAKKASAK